MSSLYQQTVVRFRIERVTTASSLLRHISSPKIGRIVCSIEGNNYFYNNAPSIINERYPVTARYFSVTKDTIEQQSGEITNNNNNNDNTETPANDEWIPPNRPLIGDIGQSFMYEAIQPNSKQQQEISSRRTSTISTNEIDLNEITDEELLFQKELELEQLREAEELRQIEYELQRIEDQEEVKKRQMQQKQIKSTAPDWLKLRRSIYGNDTTSKETTTSNTSSSESSNSNDLIPTKLYTLLSKNEIMKCLHALGAEDIVVILDDMIIRRMGGPLGMIIATGTSSTQIRTLGQAIVYYLRQRQLHQLNVVGATHGIEDDAIQQQNWIVIDCYNYVVHIQDAPTRKAVNLQGLWSGEDPLFTINFLNDDAVDDYVAAHPVPEDYIRSVGGTGGGYASIRSSNSTTADIIRTSSSFTDTIQQLQKSRWTVNRPIPTVSSSSSSSSRRSSNKRRGNRTK